MEEERRQAELNRVATAAAQEAAAAVVRLASEAAHQVTATAANAANVLAEATKVDLGYIKADLREIKDQLNNKFVTIEAFAPVRNLVYGLTTLLLTGVILGLLAIVLKR